MRGLAALLIAFAIPVAAQQRDPIKAIELFRRSIAFDDCFAQAHTALATAVLHAAALASGPSKSFAAAAREAGRAIGTAPDPVTGQERALRAAQLVVEDQSVDATDVHVAYAAAGTDCESGIGYTPTLTPGEEFSVCVTVTVRIPLLPEFIDANTATGQFVVERDRYIDG